MSDVLSANLSESSLTFYVRVQAWPTASRDHASDPFMPTVTTSWQRRTRRGEGGRGRKRRRSLTWQAAGERGTSNSFVEDPRGSSSGHWTIKASAQNTKSKCLSCETAPIKSKSPPAVMDELSAPIGPNVFFSEQPRSLKDQ